VYVDNMQEKVMALFLPTWGSSPSLPTWRKRLWHRRY